MKLQKIIKLAKKRKKAILMEDSDGVQWLSTGEAVYILDGMPFLDEETVLSVMGIPDDQREKWFTSYRKDENGVLENNVVDEIEVTADDAGISIDYNGIILTPIYTNDGVIWLDTTLLEPTTKKEMGYQRFFVRKNGKGRCIAVKEGLVLTALIMEYEQLGDKLTDALTLLAERSRAERIRRVREDGEDVAKYETCEACGANLDHGEACDCQQGQAKQKSN